MRGFSGTLVVARDITDDATARRAQDEFMTHMSHELKGPAQRHVHVRRDAAGGGGRIRDLPRRGRERHPRRGRTAGDTDQHAPEHRADRSGSSHGQRQRVRLQDFLRDVVDAVSRSGAHAGLRFSVDVPADASPIFVEKELFRVAVNNLLTNAIKYNRDGGEVCVSVEESAGRVSIRVRDTGLGIREEDLPRIFEKFYRSDDNEIQKLAGHGLGLSLTREIVELHGGSIEVQTEPGVGSEFTIVLRRRASDSEEAQEA